jgi:tetratricopeptide (TPR) repeat protein
MNFLSIRKLAGLFAALAALAIATPAFAQSGGFEGKATKPDGSVCAGCWIVIERQDFHGVYKVKTNRKGEYVYIGLPLGLYKITLEDPDGKSLHSLKQQATLGDPVEVDFDLPKLAASQQQEQEKEAKSNPAFAKQLAEQQKVEVEQKKSEKEVVELKQYFDQGNALSAQKDYKGAAAAYEKALPFAHDQNVPVVLGRLAESYQQAQEYQQAADTYQKAIQANPNDANFHNDLGSMYGSLGKFPEAQAEFEKAAQLDPANASMYYSNIGAVMYNAGKMDEAAQAYKKVISVNPKNAQAYFLEGEALMGKVTLDAKGKVVAPPGTVEAFEAYLKLDPNGPNAAAARQMIETLQGNFQTQYKRKK